MKIMPIDTIKIRFRNVDPIALHIEEWEHCVTLKGKQEHVVRDEWRRDVWLPNGAHLRFTYRAVDLYDPTLVCTLLVEFSIPTVLFGCSHAMVRDWQSALNELNDILATFPGMDSLGDIRDAELFRLDVAVNVQAGEDVDGYIAAASKANYPRRVTLPYIEGGKKTGVIIKPRKRPDSLCMYNKFLECEHQAAQGLLRIERSIRRPSIISELLGVEHCRVRDLLPDALWDLLEANLKTLGMERPVVSNRLEVEGQLREVYGCSQVRELLGYLVLKTTKGIEQLVREGMSSDSVSRFEALLRNAKLTCLSLEDKTTLPPLLDLVREMRKYGGTGSDTTGSAANEPYRPPSPPENEGDPAADEPPRSGIDESGQEPENND